MRILFDLRGSTLRAERFSILKRICERMGFSVTIVKEDFSPSECAAIIIFPKKNWIFSPKEIKEIKGFVLRGGALFVFCQRDSEGNSNIDDLLKTFGIFPANKILNNYIVVKGNQWIDKSHPACRNINEVHLIKPSSVRVLKRHYIRILIRNPDINNPLPLAVTSIYGSGRVIFIGSAEMFSDDVIALGDNANFILSLLSWALHARKVDLSDIIKTMPKHPLLINVKTSLEEKAEGTSLPKTLPTVRTEEKPKERKVLEKEVMMMPDDLKTIILSEIKKIKDEFKAEINSLRKFVEEKLTKYEGLFDKVNALLKSIEEIKTVKKDLSAGIERMKIDTKSLHTVISDLCDKASQVSDVLSKVMKSDAFISLETNMKSLLATTRALQNWIASLSDEVKHVESMMTGQKNVQQLVQAIYDIVTSIVYQLQTVSKGLSDVSNVLAHLEQLIISLTQEQMKVLSKIVEELKKLNRTIEKSLL